MATPIAIPVTVTPEAAALVAELGMQRELDEMVQHTLETIPGLQSITVVVELPYDTGIEDTISIEARVDMKAPGLYQAEEQWQGWVISTFPSRVLASIRLLTLTGTSS